MEAEGVHKAIDVSRGRRRVVRPSVGRLISVGGGGWDWFAVNLEDGTDLTLSLVRDTDGSYRGLRDDRGRGAGDASPRARCVHGVGDPAMDEPDDRGDRPMGRPTHDAGERLTIDLEPTVAAQELDTRSVDGCRVLGGATDRQRAAWVRQGEAYVELTGYGPAGVAP